MPRCRVELRTPMGPGWVVFDGDRVVETVIPGSEPPEVLDADRVPAPVGRWVGALEAYYAGDAVFLPAPGLAEIAGRTDLERLVYSVVASTRPGETRTYAQVAAAAGRPGAARAVGAAMARNPFAPIIPCHRVVGSDGTLRGYAGGLAAKSRLLEMEAAGA